MPKSNVTVRIPQIVSLETAIRLYYEKNELSNADIQMLFGHLANDTVSKLKHKARELMQERNTPVWNASRVNTEVAYESWGLEISKLEYRWKKLKAMGMEEKCPTT